MPFPAKSHACFLYIYLGYEAHGQAETGLRLAARLARGGCGDGIEVLQGKWFMLHHGSPHKSPYRGSFLRYRRWFWLEFSFSETNSLRTVSAVLCLYYKIYKKGCQYIKRFFDEHPWTVFHVAWFICFSCIFSERWFDEIIYRIQLYQGLWFWLGK